MQIIKYDCKGKKENGRKGPQCHPKNLGPNKRNKREMKYNENMSYKTVCTAFTIIYSLFMLHRIIKKIRIASINLTDNIEQM